jgi:hypothetical protein
MTTPERAHVHLPGETREGAWKDSLQHLLSTEATKRARAHVSTRDAGETRDLVMRVPVTFFLRFAVDGQQLASDGEPDCICTIFREEDGSEVCVCIGQCPDFPECCDDGPPFTEGR